MQRFNYKERYLKDVSLLLRPIREYDMSKANISILFSKDILSKDEYEYFLSAPREERQIKIGLMQRNKNISKTLSDGFKEYMTLFVESNNISNENILSIKKDAIFLIDFIPKVTEFHAIRFVQKNSYSAFMYVPSNDRGTTGLELYYKENCIDVKGMSDENILLHNGYMLDVFEAIFESLLSSPRTETISLLKNISDMYKNKHVEPEYYREFNSRSLYRTFYTIADQTYYLKDIRCDWYYSGLIDGGFNYRILMYIYSILLK